VDAVADVLVAAEEIVRRIARRPRAAGFGHAAHFPTARGADAWLRWRRRPVVEDAVRTALRLLVGVEDDAPTAGEAQGCRARKLGIEAGTRIGARRQRADGCQCDAEARGEGPRVKTGAHHAFRVPCRVAARSHASALEARARWMVAAMNLRVAVLA